MTDPYAPRLPFAIDPDKDDAEIVALIESWSYRGPAVSWDAVVGHLPQVRRCQEVVEALRRPEADLERLHIRLGRGLVLSGPPGIGKTVLARSVAGAVQRDVISPPVSELTPGLIARLYAQLARMEPSVLVLDESELVIATGVYGGNEDLGRALAIALDSLSTPNRAPITLALTTVSEYQLSPVLTRPGRLSPRLDLGLPTGPERRILLERAIAGLPIAGPSPNLDLVIQRTGGWSGAEIAVAVDEAMSRSLLDGTDALTEENLLAIVAQRYVITDPSIYRLINGRRTALHEAAHAIYAHRHWPGAVALVSLSGEQPGVTRLDEDRFEMIDTSAGYRTLAGMALASLACERLFGPEGDGIAAGSSGDRAKATMWLRRSMECGLPWDRDILEQGHESDRGSERMRAALHASIEESAADLLAEVVAELAPLRSAIESLAQELLEADDLSLSGGELLAALDKSLAQAP
jgi:SpoVK/Ycf46/Vps4 family AAA+-type ATPase